MVLRRIIIILLLGYIFHPLPVCAEAGSGTFHKAARLYRAREWQAAADTFEACLNEAAIDPESRRLAQFYRGESLVQLKQYAVAINAFDSYLQTAANDDTNRQRALFQLGSAAAATEQWALAEQNLRLLLESAKLDAMDALRESATLRLADVCFQTRKFADSAVLFHQLATLSDDATRRWEAAYGEARSLELDNQYAAARQQYQTLAETTDVAAGGRALLALSLMEFGQGRFEACVATLRELNDRFPSSDFRGESYYWQGRAHLQLSEPGLALRDLKQAQLQFERGSDNQLLRSATADYVTIAEQRIASGDAQSRPQLPSQYSASGDEHGPQSVPFQPPNPGCNSGGNSCPLETYSLDDDVWAEAEQQISSGNYQQATRTFLRLAALHPGTEEARNALSAAAKCYEQAGQLEDARLLYSRLVSDGGADVQMAQQNATRRF